MEDLINRQVLTDEELETFLAVSPARIAKFKSNTEMPNEHELGELKTLVEEKTQWD